MPYRHAWWVVIMFVGLTVMAFWPGYFSVLGKAPMAFHTHGVTATLWMLLLIAQAWTIHHGRRALHRSLGLATFALVPLFIAGGLGVIQTMSRATVAGNDPFYAIYGARLGSFDMVSTIAFGYLTFMALKERRNVQLHARYMLATALLLIGPVMVRLTDRYIPGLIINGPQDFGLFAVNLRLSSVAVVAIAATLYLGNRRFGRPWLIAGGVTLLQAVLFETLSKTSAWQSVFAAIAPIPAAVLLTIGVVSGAVLMVVGWQSTPPRKQRTATT